MADESPDTVEAFAGDVGDGVDRHADCDLLDGREGAVEVCDEIALRQDDDRLRAALPGGCEVALEPAQVQIADEARHEEGDVHVRGEHLPLGRLRGAPSQVAPGAREGGAAWQDGMNDTARAGGGRPEGHPVADGRQIRGAGRARLQLP